MTSADEGMDAVVADGDTKPLIELIFKPNALGQRPSSAEIALLLSYSRQILEEAGRMMIDGPEQMRESEASSDDPDGDTCR